MYPELAIWATSTVAMAARRSWPNGAHDRMCAPLLWTLVCRRDHARKMTRTTGPIPTLVDRPSLGKRGHRGRQVEEPAAHQVDRRWRRREGIDQQLAPTSDELHGLALQRLRAPAHMVDGRILGVVEWQRRRAL